MVKLRLGCSSLLHQEGWVGGCVGVGVCGGAGGGMSNDADRRGGGSKHTGLLFLLDISPRGTISVTPLLKCIMVLSVPPAAEPKTWGGGAPCIL